MDLWSHFNLVRPTPKNYLVSVPNREYFTSFLRWFVQSRPPPGGRRPASKIISLTQKWGLTSTLGTHLFTLNLSKAFLTEFIFPCWDGECAVFWMGLENLQLLEEFPANIFRTGGSGGWKAINLISSIIIFKLNVQTNLNRKFWSIVWCVILCSRISFVLFRIGIVCDAIEMVCKFFCFELQLFLCKILFRCLVLWKENSRSLKCAFGFWKCQGLCFCCFHGSVAV